MASIFEELSKGGEAFDPTQTPPSEKIVDWLHARASTTQPDDLHHKIGHGSSDAAAGDHTHNGVNSKFLFNSSEVAFSDLTSGASTADIVAAVNAIHAALRRVGAG